MDKGWCGGVAGDHLEGAEGVGRGRGDGRVEAAAVGRVEAQELLGRLGRRLPTGR